MINAYPMLAGADKALAEGRLDEAARLALKHVRDFPGEPRGVIVLGSIAMNMGALNSAERFFRQALAHDPADLDVMTRGCA